MLKKKQSDINRRQAGTHLQTVRMDNLWQGVSYTMEIIAKTLGLQADYSMYSEKYLLTRKSVFSRILLQSFHQALF